MLDRRQTQHLAVSAWGVPQCGQRHIGMAGWCAANPCGVEWARGVMSSRAADGYLTMEMTV